MLVLTFIQLLQCPAWIKYTVTKFQNVLHLHLFKLMFDLLLSPPFLQELASLGLDRLKSALMALGLKCGG